MLSALKSFEGAMGVLYGDNAVAGVINIVSKRYLGYEWELQGSLQEETVGNEYALFDRGKHIQNLKIGHAFSDNANATVGVSKNKFAGFYNNFNGQNYTNIDDTGLVVDDKLRGSEWSPKDQITLFGNFNLKIKKHNLHYKFQYYNEVLDVFSHTVNGSFRCYRKSEPYCYG